MAQQRTQLGIAAGSIAIGLIVLGIKFAAFSLTGSVALFSDALESTVNVVTAVATLAALLVARRPADAALPFGYHKAEYFSAVLVGVLIVVAAILIVMEALPALVDPVMPEAPGPGLMLASAATVINFIWARVLIARGRRANSPALSADGRHLMTDVVSTIGVLVGLGLAFLTGFPLIDPILALLVAVNVLWSGWVVIRDSVGGLMDAAVPSETLQRIETVIANSANGALEAHDIRTRAAGPMVFIDFHLVVPGAMPVSEAHAICDAIENGLRAAVRTVQVTIHVEPEDKAKPGGALVL